jgi:hypothetical protein
MPDVDITDLYEKLLDLKDILKHTLIPAPGVRCFFAMEKETKEGPQLTIKEVAVAGWRYCDAQYDGSHTDLVVVQGREYPELFTICEVEKRLREKFVAYRLVFPADPDADVEAWKIETLRR